MLTAILKRIGLVVLGYFAAIASGTITFPVVLMVISLFEPSSQVWDWLGLTPIAMVVAPVIALFLISTAVAITFAQAILAHAASEFFAVRSLPAHLAIAAVIGLSGGLLLVPDWFSSMDLDKWLVTLAALLGAVAGGLVYWAIAGRKAGLRPGASA